MSTAASSADVSRSDSSPSAPAAAAPPPVPKPAKRTLKSERFIALHISWVRIAPDAPTSVPAISSA